MSNRRNNAPPKMQKKKETVKAKKSSSNKFKKLIGWRDETGRIYADASRLKVVQSNSKIDKLEANPDTDFVPVTDSELEEATLPPPELPARPDTPKKNGKLIAGIIALASLVVIASIVLACFVIPRLNSNANTAATTSSKSTTGSNTSETTIKTTDLAQADVKETTAATSSGDMVLEYNGHRYMIYEKVLSWKEAEEYCEIVGGHLATITSVGEQEFIFQLNSSDLKLWIGGYKDSSDDWNWITYEDWDYTNWADGEPSNDDTVGGYENSVAVWPMSWNDLNENNTIKLSGFICEWDGLDVKNTDNMAGDEIVQVSAEPVDITDLITDITSSSEDDESYGNFYPAYHLIDDDLDTSWAEGSEGDGIGDYVTIYIPKGTVISGIVVYTGYCKSENVFYKNGAPSVIDVSSGATGYRVNLNNAENNYAASNLDVAIEGVEITFPTPIVSNGELKITIVAVRQGTDWSDTNMSEIKLIGWPAE